MSWVCSRFLLRILVSPKIKIHGLWAQGHVRKSRNSESAGFEGFTVMKSRSYKFKLKRNNTTELLSISFTQIYHKSEPTIKTNKHLWSFQAFWIFYRHPIGSIFGYSCVGSPTRDKVPTCWKGLSAHRHWARTAKPSKFLAKHNLTTQKTRKKYALLTCL